MKKIIILTISIILSFPVVAENVVGIELGGKVTPENNLKKTNTSGQYQNVYSSKDVPFFDTVQVEADSNDIIRSIAFVKSYDFTIHELDVRKKEIVDGYKTMLSTLEKKYGSFDTSDAKGITGYKGGMNTFYMGEIKEAAKNESVNSDSLGAVYLMFRSPNNEGFMLGEKKQANLYLLYLDKSALKKIKDKKEKTLSGF